MILISMSLQNILAALRRFVGQVQEVRYVWPDDLESFNEPWKNLTGVIHAAMNPSIPTLIPLTVEEIRAAYKRT